MASDPFYKSSTADIVMEETPTLRQSWGQQHKAKQASIQAAAQAKLTESRAEGGTPLEGQELLLAKAQSGEKGSGWAAFGYGLGSGQPTSTATAEERKAAEAAAKQARLDSLMQVLAARTQR